MTTLKQGARRLERAAARLEDNVNDEIQDTLDSVEISQKAEIKRPKPRGGGITANNVASGTLLASFRQPPPEHHHPWGTRHRLFNHAPHAQLVEFGTGVYNGWQNAIHSYYGVHRVFKAPRYGERLVRNIEAWMVQRGISSFGELTRRETAQEIARGISVRGTRPGTPKFPFFYRAMFHHEELLKARVNRAVRQAFTRR